MEKIQPAPELVDPAPAVADPAPAEGQPAETPTEATPPQSFHIGDADYTSDELAEHLERSTNASKMHKSAHEEYTAAKALREEMSKANNDPQRKRLDFIMQTLNDNPELASQWERLDRMSFSPDGTPTNALGMGAQLRDLTQRVESLSADKGAMQADDYLKQFADAKGITKEQAEEVGAKFLADTTRDDFPDTNVLSHLNYFYFENYEKEGAESKLADARQAGYNEALGKVKAGQAAELGSPASRSEVPWTPPKGSSEIPMRASFDAAMDDDSIQFGD